MHLRVTVEAKSATGQQPGVINPANQWIASVEMTLLAESVIALDEHLLDGRAVRRVTGQTAFIHSDVFEHPRACNFIVARETALPRSLETRHRGTVDGVTVGTLHSPLGDGVMELKKKIAFGRFVTLVAELGAAAPRPGLCKRTDSATMKVDRLDFTPSSSRGVCLGRAINGRDRVNGIRVAAPTRHAGIRVIAAPVRRNIRLVAAQTQLRLLCRIESNQDTSVPDVRLIEALDVLAAVTVAGLAGVTALRHGAVRLTGKRPGDVRVAFSASRGSDRLGPLDGRKLWGLEKDSGASVNGGS